MKIYLINGEKGIGKTDFSVNLAEKLAERKKVLLTSFFRDDNSNIEDYFQKDGMVTYDIADYFLETCDIDKVEVEENKNLSFIIPPLVENKYDFSEDDVYTLIENIDADILIIDNLDMPIKNAISVEILSEKDINKEVSSKYYFINKANENFDPRLHKENLNGKSATFLGVVKKDEYFKNIIDNLLEGKSETIGTLSLIEKIKKFFTK